MTAQDQTKLNWYLQQCLCFPPALFSHTRTSPPPPSCPSNHYFKSNTGRGTGSPFSVPPACFEEVASREEVDEQSWSSLSLASTKRFLLTHPIASSRQAGQAYCNWNFPSSGCSALPMLKKWQEQQPPCFPNWKWEQSEPNCSIPLCPPPALLLLACSTSGGRRGGSLDPNLFLLALSE